MSGKNAEGIKTEYFTANVVSAKPYVMMRATIEAIAAITAATAETTQMTVVITNLSFSVRSLEAGVSTKLFILSTPGM